jgi:membrane-associated phospholipid phosphatase
MNKFGTGKRMQGARYFILLLALWIIAGALILCLQCDKALYIAINARHTPFLDHVLAWVTYAGTFPVVLIALLLLFLYPPFRKWKVLLAALTCNIVPFLIIQVLKNFINAPRPLKYFHNADWINFVAGQPRNFNLSFPSGHTEGIFALCCFLSLMLPAKYARWGVLLFVIALLVAFSRIYLSQHFLKDIYGGSIIGSLCVLVLFAIINPFEAKAKTKRMEK